MKTTTQNGYAKINLHLDITGIMPNGFHSVNTVMHSLTLCDTVTLTENDGGKYTVDCNISGVPLGEDNLAVRAAMLFREAVPTAPYAHIYIEKRIPMAAGLAGGSADAAAVLRGMNELCGEPLSMEELCAIGSRLGSDVPFCICVRPAFATGKGDVLEPFPAMPDCTVVVACGGEGVSTPAAYKMLDTLHGGFAPDCGYVPRPLSALRESAQAGDIEKLTESMYNIFEEPVLAVRPVAKKLKELMLEVGALGAMMSGSGPSVFGIFTDREKALRAAEAINQQGVTPHICTPIA